MIEIIPTHVPSSLEDLAAGAERIRKIASTIHIDIDDGMFAPHLTWPYTTNGMFGDVELSPTGGLFAEIHLMVQEPKAVGAAFARAGAARIIGHVEGFADDNEVRGALDAWRKAGAQEVGLGLLLQTPFEVVAPLVPVCDVIHLMSIATIGVQGIAYDAGAPARIAEFHERFPGTLISVDGGVSGENIAELARAGATRFGVGAAISKASDPEAAYEKLKSLAENAIHPVR